MKVAMKSLISISAALCLGMLGCSATNPRVATKTNDQAYLVGELPWNPLQGKVITSWIGRRDSTMTTMFGNDVAVQYARSSSQPDYPAGSMLTAVTWNQQEDARWFGGKIPAAPKSVEFLTITSDATGPHAAIYRYEDYEGQPLKRISVQQGSVPPNERAAYLLAQRAAVLP